MNKVLKHWQCGAGARKQSFVRSRKFCCIVAALFGLQQAIKISREVQAAVLTVFLKLLRDETLVLQDESVISRDESCLARRDSRLAREW